MPNPLRHGIAATLALAAFAAQAQIEIDGLRLDEAPAAAATGGGRIGGAVFGGYRYLGSDERRTGAVPLVEYRWASGWFAGTGSGAGYAFVRERDWGWGLRAGLDFGRRERRSDALRGMGDIDANPEIGAFYYRALAPAVRLDTSVRFGAGGSGLLADAGVSWLIGLAPSLGLRLGVAATAANEAYMQDFFGVTPVQSAASGYAVTNAGAGLRDLRASATLLYAITPTLALTGTLAARSLQGDARSSPLTREATPITAMVTLTTAF